MRASRRKGILLAGSGLLALLDDIATLLDDISVLTKVAAKKTAGVVGDDLALNAEQFGGIRAERELPVVWAVAKGSLVNKAILVPAALAVSALAPWAILPLLMVGGGFLCYEGVEKIVHKLTHKGGEAEADHGELLKAAHSRADLMAFEKEKVKGAIRTDLILSAEIIVIALGTVADRPLLQQATTMAVIAVALTVGVYALVAGIIKIDDAGFYLVRRAGKSGEGGLLGGLGRFLLALAPKLMKVISVVGTGAMFLVGGGIIAHGLPHSLTEGVAGFGEAALGKGSPLLSLGSLAANVGVGLLAGAVLLGAVKAAKAAISGRRAA